MHTSIIETTVSATTGGRSHDGIGVLGGPRGHWSAGTLQAGHACHQSGGQSGPLVCPRAHVPSRGSRRGGAVSTGQPGADSPSRPSRGPGGTPEAGSGTESTAQRGPVGRHHGDGTLTQGLPELPAPRYADTVPPLTGPFSWLSAPSLRAHRLPPLPQGGQTVFHERTNRHSGSDSPAQGSSGTSVKGSSPSAIPG